jgi:hypothetical protein
MFLGIELAIPNEPVPIYNPYSHPRKTGASAVAAGTK